MNKMEVKSVKTCYVYVEHYWVIDGKAITEYLDEWTQNDSAPFECSPEEIMQIVRELDKI